MPDVLNVQIDSVRLRADQDKIILKDIRFSIEPNKICSIVGKNGSGKSTLIRSLTRLLDENSYCVTGSVYFNGRNLLAADQDELMTVRRNDIKYVFQDAVNSFDHLKKFNYYFERLAASKEKIDSLLDFFLLPASTDILKRYPYEVSGGMAQRINFIIALLANPQIIILDEPTSAVDVAIGNLFLIKLKEFVEMENKSALLITQDLAFAEKASDSIAFLSGGLLTNFYSGKEFLNTNDHPQLKDFINAYKNILQ